MAVSKKIFLDSSIFMSFIDRTDVNHQRTSSIMEYLAKQNYQVYTSSLVVYQSFSLIERDLGSAVSQEFLKSILDSAIRILYISESELLFAYRFFKSSSQRRASLIEVTTARLMEKNGIVYILTYDFWHNIAGTSISSLMNTPINQFNQ